MFKFTSNTHVAINVVLPNGANAHVSFSELSGKGSVFYTDNKDLAQALRCHHRFGKMFKEEIVIEKPAKKVAEAKSESAQAPGNKGATKQFGNNEDAKEFLADRYGISRSKMRTRAAIIEAAKSVGITIEWTE